MHNTWFGVWCLAGLIIAAFSYILSLSSPVQVEMLCDLYAGFEPSQPSCLVGKSVSWRADGRGFESHLRQPIFLWKMTVSGASCIALPFCCVVASFQHLLEYIHVHACTWKNISSGARQAILRSLDSAVSSLSSAGNTHSLSSAPPVYIRRAHHVHVDACTCTCWCVYIHVHGLMFCCICVQHGYPSWVYVPWLYFWCYWRGRMGVCAPRWPSEY